MKTIEVSVMLHETVVSVTDMYSSGEMCVVVRSLNTFESTDIEHSN